MKKFICMAMALTLIFALTACGNNNKNKSDSTSDSESSQSSEAETNSLTVYSPLPPKLLNAATTAFTAETGIAVQTVSDSSSALLKRIAAGDTADVLFGAGAEVVRGQAKLFAPYATTEKPQLDSTFLTEDDLYTPFTPMPIVIMYNKSQTTQAPTGWLNLINNSYRGWVAFANPAASGTSYTALCVTQQLKKELGSDYIDKLCVSIAGKMMTGIADVYKNVGTGEFAAGITLESSAQKYIEAGYDGSIGIVYPSEGTTAALEVSAIIEGTKKEADAQKFIDYISGADFQKVLVSEFKQRTARSDIDDPEGLTPRKDIKFIAYDIETAVSGRTELLKKFSETEKKATEALDDKD